jgi:hypothetical protein
MIEFISLFFGIQIKSTTKIMKILNKKTIASIKVNFKNHF